MRLERLRAIWSFGEKLRKLGVSDKCSPILSKITVDLRNIHSRHIKIFEQLVEVAVAEVLIEKGKQDKETVLRSIQGIKL